MRYSSIIPVHNEEESILPLYHSLKNVFDALGQPYEIIFVNDCSSDNSRQVLRAIEGRDANLAVVDLDSRRGKSGALQAGFCAARGEIVITMDGDLQNDPADIPKLLDKIKGGADVVCGWRYNRMDPWLKSAASKVANFVRRAFTKERIHDCGSDFIALKRECLRGVYLSGGLHRFLPLIMLKLGYRVEEVKVEHRARKFGKAKYTIRNRLIDASFDMMRFIFLDVHDIMKCKR